MSEATNPFQPWGPEEAACEVEPEVHVHGPGAGRDTKIRGHGLVHADRSWDAYGRAAETGGQKRLQQA